MNVQTAPVVASSRGLWVAVAALSVAVVGLGATLLVQHHASPESSVDPSTAPVATTATPAPSSPAAAAPSALPALKHAPAAVSKAKTPPSAQVAAAQPPAYAPPAPSAPPVCADCATVLAVTPIEHEGSSNGAGAVAGGLLGALVGNQFGRGSGKDALTVLGAIGGGVAGNQIEKKMKKVTTYRIDLRMDDGRTQQLELSQPVGAGQRVRVNGGSLEPLSPDHG